jgi:predicted nucleotidyltransferase
MREEIEAALNGLAAQHGVRILFACESGSRAWGFASPDSDYDVRFIYVHPLEGYLRVRAGRDVIEAMLPGDLDLAGWDLRKTLGLLSKSNPSLFEWLLSPIVYSQDSRFVKEFTELAKGWYSDQRILLHYLHMAQGNWQGYLQGESVSRKKYLYCLRPILACQWIEQGRGQVPMEFDRLLPVLDGRDDVLAAIQVLLKQKMAGDELSQGPPDPMLHGYLSEQLTRLSGLQLEKTKPRDITELDAFFRDWILSS